MKTEAAGAAGGVTFPGGEGSRIPWMLLGFILLSACAHGLGFFLFQTIYPPAAHLGPPPVQVGLLTPGTPEADAILRWIELEDPARAAEPGKAPIPGLMNLPYLPSYRTVHARPVMIPVPEDPLPYPGGVAGMDLVKMAEARASVSPPPPSPVATALVFSGGLEKRAMQPPLLDGLREGDPASGTCPPARFLLGVSDQGEVRYVFLQEASGDKALDDAAGRLLEQVRFKPSAEPLTWGFATFYWGSSVYARPSPGPEEGQ